VPEINAFEPTMAAMSDDLLGARRLSSKRVWLAAKIWMTY
jgi:hypothetical protein